MSILGKERKEDWEAVYEGATGLADLYEEDPESKGMNAVVGGFRLFMEGMFAAMDEGKPVVWHNCGCSPELIRGLENVQTVPIESTRSRTVCSTTIRLAILKSQPSRT